MLTNEFFEMMDWNWSSAGCIESIALRFGLNPSGSNHCPSTLNEIQARTRLSELIVIRMRERPDLPSEKLPQLQAPPSTPGCTIGTNETLTPLDYMGLGVRNGIFSFEVLREHTFMIPGATNNAVTIVLQNTSRQLKCQRIFCNHDICTNSQWSVCKHCMLGVYCGQCESSLDLPCRYCLKHATISELPNRWMWDRAKSIARFNDKYKFEESDAFNTVIYTDAVAALCDTAARVSL